tara:strand:- start:1107 stop:2264 length:1158 start_codon:yes stop_codon:yes gene_type:complete
MSEPVKQEGDFKIKKKTPRKFSNEPSAPAKIDLSQPKEADVTKVVIDQPIEETSEPAVATQEVVEEIPQETAPAQLENTVLQEITEEEVQQETKKVEAEIKEAVRDERVSGKPLPENVEKLVLFMEETGGTVQDYVRLNADYTTINDTALLKEYYSKTKPYLEGDDVNILLEDFSYDEELDDEKDIRKRKIAFKEEVGKAKHYLEGLKSKYYDEIKLRPGATQEQQKAVDFFNRYKEEEQVNAQSRDAFVHGTNNYFSNDFKGFNFNVGEKKFRYSVKDTDNVKANQSDLKSVVGKFLNEKGQVSNYADYHKAIYAARNADTLAQHFYEQGKADAVRDITAKSNNIQTDVRQSASGSVFVNGLKVKSISGADSSKLKIKKRNFKN